MYTTKDTQLVAHLATQGQIGEVEKIGEVIWFNYEDDKAEKLAEKFINTRQKIYNIIFKLI